MGRVVEVLELEDRFSKTFGSFLTMAEQASRALSGVTHAANQGTMSLEAMANVAVYTNGPLQRMESTIYDIRDSLLNVETATATAAVGMQDMASRMSQATTQGNTLLITVRNLAGAFLGIQTGQWLVGTSDQLTQINARLQLMTGSAEAAAEANEQIYQAAMRARGAYTDMADLVSQLGTLAPDAFSDTGEIVAFAEQLQKQMALSGTSTQAAQAAMLQLTQGLASGVLRGEELNSVLEQTPMVAQTIADYMGVNVGTMRELASEGAITADVVKNALLGAAQETNAAFAQMPMTWGQVWNTMQNVAIRALDPVLGGINFLANNIEIIGPLVLGLGAAFTVFMVAANWVNITTAAVNGLNAAHTALKTVMATTWGPPLIAIILITTAIYAVTAAVNQFAGTSVSATGLIAGGFLSLLAVVGNFALMGINLLANFGNFFGNFLNDPIAAVEALIFDLATTVLGVVSKMAHGIEDLINAIPGMEINITGKLDNLYNQAKTAAQTAKDEAGWVEYFKTNDYINLGGAFQTGYNAGVNFDPLGVLSGAGGNLDLSQYTTGVTPYDQLGGISDQLSNIGGSVKGIEKSVDMSDEDIKALVDVAERRYVNQVNLTSQTPVITVNGANTGRTAQDRRALADAIEQILREEWASGSVRSTAYA